MKAHSQSVAERLASGAVRGLGAAISVAEEAQSSVDVLRELVVAVEDKRNIVTIRAANALGRVQKAKPELLLPYARALLRAASRCTDTRTRWNLTNVVGSMSLRGRDKALAVELLFDSLRSESGFLRTFAMAGLVNLAMEDEGLRRRVRPIVHAALEDKSAAMRARARKLCKLASS